MPVRFLTVVSNTVLVLGSPTVFRIMVVPFQFAAASKLLLETGGVLGLG